MINSAQKDRVVAVLTKHGLHEQKLSKGMFCKEDNSGISADLTGKEPVIGMMLMGKVQPKGNSNREIDDIQREVAAVMKPASDKFRSPAIDLSAPPKEAAKGSGPVSGGIDKAPELKGNKAANDVVSGAIPSESKLGAGDNKTSNNPVRPGAEAYNFLQLCKYRDLNPFLKEAYLVKYGDAAATMIVGKDAFTRKAEESGKLDGFEAGIIVSQNADQKNAVVVMDERIGTILNTGEQLIGGWAKVYRKDRSKPFHIQVSMQEYDKKKNNWVTMPGTMIRKVALVQALREAFTKELGGCYDAAEVDTQG